MLKPSGLPVFLGPLLGRCEDARQWMRIYERVGGHVGAWLERRGYIGAYLLPMHGLNCNSPFDDRGKERLVTL